MNESNKVILPNMLLLGEVSRMLSERRTVIIPTKGRSMLPFIRGERDSVALVRKEEINPGDIVLAVIDGSRYVLHRVWSVSGDDVELMGDGNIAGHEHCRRTDVCGTVYEIIRENGRKVDVNSAGFRRKSRIWIKLLPFRRYILWINRKISRII